VNKKNIKKKNIPNPTKPSYLGYLKPNLIEKIPKTKDNG
jgi:hypothetical protein